MISTSPTRTALRKYAQGKSPEIQGAVRNLVGTMRILEKDPTDAVALERMVINHAAFKALTSEDREKSGG